MSKTQTTNTGTQESSEDRISNTETGKANTDGDSSTDRISNDESVKANTDGQRQRDIATLKRLLAKRFPGAGFKRRKARPPTPPAFGGK